MRRDRRDRAGLDDLRDPVKPVKDEPKIPVELRPDQLADIIDAVLAFADDCANDREILQSMPRVDRDTVEDLLQRETALPNARGMAAARTGGSEVDYFAPRMRPIPPPCGRNCPGPKRHMPRRVLHLDALREHPEPHLRRQPPRQGQPAARSCSGKADGPCRQPDKEAQTHCEIASTTPASGRRGAPP